MKFKHLSLYCCLAVFTSNLYAQPAIIIAEAELKAAIPAAAIVKPAEDLEKVGIKILYLEGSNGYGNYGRFHVKGDSHEQAVRKFVEGNDTITLFRAEGTESNLVMLVYHPLVRLVRIIGPK